MYSGGLDSLGMIYKLLTDQQYKQYNIHIHHIHHRNVENRDRAEAIAVDLSLKELRMMGYTFEYSESEIGSQQYGKHFMHDTDSVNFFAGYVASVNPDVVKIAVGMQANDFDGTNLDERRIRANKILSAFTDAEKIYPVMNLSKKEIYDMLPETVKNKFWSCRRPIYTETRIMPCGTCGTCLKLKDQGIR